MDADLPTHVVPSQVHTQSIADVAHDQRVTDAVALRAIEAATPVLRAIGLQPSLYRATVSRYDGTLHVGFMDKDVPRTSTAMGIPAR